MVETKNQTNLEYGLPSDLIARLFDEGRSSLKASPPEKITDALEVLDKLAGNRLRAARFSEEAVKYALQYFGVQDGQLEIDAELMSRQCFAAEVTKAFGYKAANSVRQSVPAAEIQKS